VVNFEACTTIFLNDSRIQFNDSRIHFNRATREFEHWNFREVCLKKNPVTFFSSGSSSASGSRNGTAWTASAEADLVARKRDAVDIVSRCLNFYQIFQLHLRK
jgi:hypothetical protein